MTEGRTLWPRHYTDPGLHGEEQARLFARHWQFVGFADQLAAPNAFLTREIAGRPVLVQNFAGEDGGSLRAFRNVCSHRFARLHRADSGAGMVRCPYHGWTYDRNGVPVGIPRNEECFGLDRAGKEALALPRYEVEACGRFLFVRLEPGGPGLDESLGAHAPLLRRLSDTFAAPFAEEAVPWEADWKVGVENVLEVYHVDSVHPDTFRTVTEGPWDCAYDGPHSTGVTGLTPDTARWWEGVAGRLRLEPAGGLGGYHHVLLFPNLAIGVTAGLMMSVQTYEPAGSGRCTLRWRLSLARGAEGASRAARQGVEEHLAAFNRRLLAEDRAICEEVQRGTRAMDRPPLLGRNEERIRRFHAAVLDAAPS